MRLHSAVTLHQNYSTNIKYESKLESTEGSLKNARDDLEVHRKYNEYLLCLLANERKRVAFWRKNFNESQKPAVPTVDFPSESANDGAAEPLATGDCDTTNRKTNIDVTPEEYSGSAVEIVEMPPDTDDSALTQPQTYLESDTGTTDWTNSSNRKRKVDQEDDIQMKRQKCFLNFL